MALVAGIVCLTGLARAAPELSARALLDDYDHGDYDAVVSNLPTRRDSLGSFAGDLEDTAATWISTAPPADRPRRRLVAAAVALEAARGFTVHPNVAKMTEAQWPDRQRLLEWGCRLVRETNPVPPAERWWQLASVALLEQSYGYPFYAFTGAWDDAREQIAHAQSRFPDEPRLALALAIVAEESAGLVGYALDSLPNAPLDAPRYDVRVRETPAGTIDLVLSEPFSPRRAPPPGMRLGRAGARGGRPAGPPVFPTDKLDFRVPLRDAVRGYAALLPRDVVGAEAELHLGAIEISLDQPEAALPHLDLAVRGVQDPVARYAAEFYRGAALTRLGEVQEAEAAFRAALAIQPHAESATVGLAWLLMINEHRSEASALVTDELAATSAARSPELSATLDPVAIYALGDARLWTDDMRRLRAALGSR